MLNHKKGDMIAVLSFTGMRFNDAEVVGATKKEIKVLKKDGSEMIFDRKTGIQTNVAEGKERFANKVMDIKDAPPMSRGNAKAKEGPAFDAYGHLSRPELKKLCKKRGLKTGPTVTMMERLLEQDNEEEVEEVEIVEEEELEEEEEEEEVSDYAVMTITDLRKLVKERGLKAKSKKDMVQALLDDDAEESNKKVVEEVEEDDDDEDWEEL